ncbi:MAG: type II toxin-antitoxin system RelE/ParE family toxin [Bacteroidales bacterium]|nr:type II toxin-antitoxin system RelE/ParE family toxin [Bacteroidales bacterium]
MKIIQSRSFKNKIKQFKRQEKELLDNQIRIIINNPAIGDKKRGELRDIYVHKFKIKNTQYLLSYRFNNKVLELIMIGPHENYYRDLKTLMKSQ